MKEHIIPVLITTGVLSSCEVVLWACMIPGEGEGRGEISVGVEAGLRLLVESWPKGWAVSEKEVYLDSSVVKGEYSVEGEKRESGATTASKGRSSKSSFLMTPGEGDVEASKKERLKSVLVSKVTSGLVTLTSATPEPKFPRLWSILKTSIVKDSVLRVFRLSFYRSSVVSPAAPSAEYQLFRVRVLLLGNVSVPLCHNITWCVVSCLAPTLPKDQSSSHHLLRRRQVDGELGL